MYLERVHPAFDLSVTFSSTCTMETHWTVFTLTCETLYECMLQRMKNFLPMNGDDAGLEHFQRRTTFEFCKLIETIQSMQDRQRAVGLRDPDVNRTDADPYLI